MRLGYERVPGSKIILVGEAWGEEEQKQCKPFVGSSGREMRTMADEAGLGHVSYTNVFCHRPGPTSNELSQLCEPRPQAPDPPFNTALARGLYLKADYFHQVRKLWEEVEDYNVVIALGNTAIWALLGRPPTVGKMRGTFWRSPFVSAKVIPTYHPAAVLRDWSLRTIVLMDLIKARNFSDSKEIKRPSRLIYIDPTLDDLKVWKEDLLSRPRISIDIEVDSPSRKANEKYISIISFAPQPDLSYVVPFLKNAWQPYWKTVEEEHEAWEFVVEVCGSPIPKLFQKHLFDTYCLRRLKPHVFVNGRIDDTLHKHHALFPEIQKDLGFMGSVWTEEAAWKLERPRGKGAKEKRDD